MGPGKPAGVTERTIGDNSDAVLFAPWDHRMLDRALAQMVEHLIAGRMAGPGDPANGVEIGNVEIADAPGPDLAVGAKLFEGGDRILERMRPAPMQKVTIENA